MSEQEEGAVSRQHGPSSLCHAHDPEGGMDLWNIGEVLGSLQQNSETTFMQANSEVVAHSNISQCIQTDDLEEASDILQDTGRVILCGFPGTGKTTVGHALLRRCREEGFKPYILPKLEDWHAHIGPGRRSFVLIDGLMGVVRVNRQQFEEWTKILRNMLELIKTGDCRVVITLYPHVLHELQQLEADSQSPMLDSSAVMRLMKEDLDTEVKRELLDFHLKQLHPQPSQQQEVVGRIVQADTSGPAFLWCCRYVVDHWQAVEDPATVFTSPAEAYSVLLKQMCLHDTHGDSFAALLALAMLGKGRFLHRKIGVQSELKNLGFTEYCDNHLAEYEDILLGSALSETDFGFSSRSWYDAAGLALGRSFRLPTLLEVCDITFLVQHVHVTVTGGTQKALKILVGSGPFACLARNNKSVAEDCRSLTQRLCEEISKGHLPDVCQHTSLNVPEFLAEMTKYCEQGKYSAKQLVKVMDTVHSLPLLYWSAVHEQHLMTDWIVSMLDHSTKADLKLFSPKVLLGLCLFSNSEHNNEDVTKPLVCQELFSAKSFQFSGDVVILPRQQAAMCEAERKASFRVTRSESETSSRQLNFLCDLSLPIPSTLVRVHVSDDTVTVQVRDRGDWYLALRLLADREVDETDRGGNTLLHIAADKGNLEAITLAVKSGASLTKTNNKGLTPYQLAQRRKEKDRIGIDRYKLSHDLYSAVRDGNEVTAKALLCYRCSVNDKDSLGRTALHCACQCCSPTDSADITRLLLDAGADVNARDNEDRTSLHYACEKGATDIVTCLLRHGAPLNTVDDMKKTPLHYACHTGVTDIVTCLTKHGAKVNAVDDRKRTPLHYACAAGHTQVARHIIDEGADVNVRDKTQSTPLHEAAEKGNTEMTLCLIEHGAQVDAAANCDVTPLHIACMSGHTQTAECLLEQGAYVDAVSEKYGTPLHIACENGQTHTAQWLLQRGADVNVVSELWFTPLHRACENGHTQTAQWLLQHGADVNAVSELYGTPLYIACKNGHTETAQWLLQHGANVNAVPEWCDTPLHRACENGHTQTAQWLLQHGADVNAVSELYGTPLYIACENGHTETAQWLLQNGANVNAVSEWCDTPLHRACENGHTQTVHCLLQHGANVNAVVKRNVTPLHRACEKGHTEAVQCLLQHGANVNIVSKRYGTPLYVARKFSLRSNDLVTLLVQHGAVSRRPITRKS